MYERKMRFFGIVCAILCAVSAAGMFVAAYRGDPVLLYSILCGATGSLASIAFKEEKRK